MGKSLITSAISSIRKLRHALVLAVSASLVGGCTISPDLKAVLEGAKSLWKGGERVSYDEAAAIPYASLGLSLGDSPEIMLILASDASGQQLWTSASRLAITLRNGRIVRTAGFGSDLGGYEAYGQSVQVDGTTIVRWRADFPELQLYAVPVVCVDQPGRDETIAILGKNIRTIRIDERCQSKHPRLDWSFSNTYWTDPATGMTWRSLQHVHPKLDPIEIEILRPPG